MAYRLQGGEGYNRPLLAPCQCWCLCTLCARSDEQTLARDPVAPVTSLSHSLKIVWRCSPRIASDV